MALFHKLETKIWSDWKIGSSAPIFRITTLLLGFRCLLASFYFMALLTASNICFCRHSYNFDIYLDHVIISSDNEHTAGATGQQSIFTSPRHMIASLSFSGPYCSALNLSFAFFLFLRRFRLYYRHVLLYLYYNGNSIEIGYIHMLFVWHIIY